MTESTANGLRPVKHLPISREELQVPVGPRRASAAGLAVVAASRPTRVIVHYGAWFVARTFGGRALPGPVGPVVTPLADVVWEALLAQWRDELGPFDAVAVAKRRQSQRGGFHVLLFDGSRATAFIKIRSTPEPLDTERRCLEAISADPRAPFRVCSPIAMGCVETNHWLAITPLVGLPHHPARSRAVPEALRYLDRALEGVVSSPGAPADWRPAHGDFAAWNFRQVGRQRWLLDFENASLAPPDADAVYWAVVATALGARRRRRLAESQAVEFWRQHIRERLQGSIDPELNGALGIALGLHDEPRD